MSEAFAIGQSSVHQMMAFFMSGEGYEKLGPYGKRE